MENKYYTPEIEEFHVGFECEFIGDRRTNWIKCVIDWMNINFITTFRELAENKYRVKYLDREDIEELGWENRSVINIWSENDEIIDGFSLSAGETDTYVLLYDESTNVLGIYLQRIYNEASGNWSEYIMFSGTIKNKSELKKLMVQLGIK